MLVEQALCLEDQVTLLLVVQGRLGLGGQVGDLPGNGIEVRFVVVAGPGDAAARGEQWQEIGPARVVHAEEMDIRLELPGAVAAEFRGVRHRVEVGDNADALEIVAYLLGDGIGRHVLDDLIGGIAQLELEAVRMASPLERRPGRRQILGLPLAGRQRVLDARWDDRTGELAPLSVDLLQPFIVDGMLQGIPDVRVVEDGIETGVEGQERDAERRQRFRRPHGVSCSGR